MKYRQTLPLVERGILTSSYKQQIKRDALLTKSKSLSKVKKMITNQSSRLESQTGTILRVSLFLIAIIMVTV